MFIEDVLSPPCGELPAGLYVRVHGKHTLAVDPALHF
jgi:hypothetical protein